MSTCRLPQTFVCSRVTALNGTCRLNQFGALYKNFNIVGLLRFLRKGRYSVDYPVFKPVVGLVSWTPLSFRAGLIASLADAVEVLRLTCQLCPIHRFLHACTLPVSPTDYRDDSRTLQRRVLVYLLSVSCVTMSCF
jgi:hypothetical protein